MGYLEDIEEEIKGRVYALENALCDYFGLKVAYCEHPRSARSNRFVGTESQWNGFMSYHKAKYCTRCNGRGWNFESDAETK